MVKATESELEARCSYDDHQPPHIHAEYQGNKAMIDFRENVLLADLRSARYVRDYVVHLELTTASKGQRAFPYLRKGASV